MIIYHRYGKFSFEEKGEEVIIASVLRDRLARILKEKDDTQFMKKLLSSRIAELIISLKEWEKKEGK